jgi:sulfite exporter TauE/SafE
MFTLKEVLTLVTVVGCVAFSGGFMVAFVISQQKVKRAQVSKT